MPDPTHAADGDIDLRSQAEPRASRFVQIAPGPEPADEKDKAGRQRGMALLLLGGGAFWAAVAAAAVYLLRR